MKIENNLNKENFFNEIQEKYPKTAEKFCTWIDEYKKAVGWNELFGKEVKFHDLPLDMQFGIITHFEADMQQGPPLICRLEVIGAVIQSFQHWESEQSTIEL